MVKSTKFYGTYEQFAKITTQYFVRECKAVAKQNEHSYVFDLDDCTPVGDFRPFRKVGIYCLCLLKEEQPHRKGATQAEIDETVASARKYLIEELREHQIYFDFEHNVMYFHWFVIAKDQAIVLLESSNKLEPKICQPKHHRFPFQFPSSTKYVSFKHTVLVYAFEMSRQIVDKIKEANSKSQNSIEFVNYISFILPQDTIILPFHQQSVLANHVDEAESQLRSLGLSDKSLVEIVEDQESDEEQPDEKKIETEVFTELHHEVLDNVLFDIPSID